MTNQKPDKWQLFYFLPFKIQTIEKPTAKETVFCVWFWNVCRFQKVGFWIRTVIIYSDPTGLKSVI